VDQECLAEERRGKVADVQLGEDELDVVDRLQAHHLVVIGDAGLLEDVEVGQVVDVAERVEVAEADRYRVAELELGHQA
jgi:hypothetical protein